MQGRAKWNAWHKLGSMSREAAASAYVQHLSALQPKWDEEQEGQQKGSKQGGMGPVFSTMATATGEEEEAGEQGSGDEQNKLHALAGEGDVQGVQALLEAGVDVDTRDEQGCTALHFAADRGCLDTARQLLGSGAQVNAQDEDGQTPLMYAALCGNQEVALMLVEDAGADLDVQNSSGQSARDLAPPSWAHLLKR